MQSRFILLSLVAGLACVLFAVTAGSAWADWQGDTTSCNGSGAVAGPNACGGVPGSATIGSNSCNGNGDFGAACGLDFSLISVGNSSCTSIGSNVRFGACGNDGSLISVGNSSCSGYVVPAGAHDAGACGNDGSLISVGAGSCNGDSNGYYGSGACGNDGSLISVGNNSCNGDSGACGNDGSLISVGNNSCNGPSACSGVVGAVGDCQDNTVVVAACDTTAPTAAPTRSPLANGAGWNNTDVTVFWNWADEPGGSGLGAASTCITPSTSTGEGTITLHSSCTDQAGNTGNADYTVKVDKTAPTFAPANVTVNATSPAGATVPAPSATDNLDPNPTVNCTPPGTLFPIGDTTVNCTATDAAGNSTPGSFTVHVQGAGDQLAALLTAVTGVGPGHALADKVKNIQQHVAKGQMKDACKDLDSFIKQVNDMAKGKKPDDMAKGKKPQITAAQAASFIAQANSIKATLGC
jgi:hypothetical protein